ncbi:MAG: replication initiator protein A [Clostridium sp.]|uniref:replication initiator protein A n=1 Tax=Clostridium sp. TaxID=1506 RepID=UPI003EE43247
MRAIKKEDLNNVVFFQVPKWLMDLFIKGLISQGAFKTYVLMFDRVRLSSKNNWIDDSGDVYIKYSYDEMQKDLECSRQAVSNNLKDLVKCDLIDKVRKFNSSSVFYLKIGSLENLTSKENFEQKSRKLDCDSLENLTDISLENLDSSNSNFSKSNLSKSNLIKNNISSEIENSDLRDDLKNKLLEFVTFRKEIKKPIKSIASIKKLVTSIGKTFVDENDLIECIDNSIMNGWQGVFPNKNKKAAPVREKSFAQRELERLEKLERGVE